MNRPSMVLSLLAAAACTSLGHAQVIQPEPLPQKDVELTIDSGVIRYEAADHERVLYSTMLDSQGAMWLRGVFGNVDLGNNAFLRITSLHDGYQQRLDHISVEQWQHKTAVFNGDAIFVEIVAPAHVAGRAHVEITGLVAGEPAFPGETICDSVDDRTRSFDNRQGRVWSIGCNAWMIDDCERCMITAGHCGPSTSAVIQFNVPLSTSGGSPVAPPPDDQYAVDPSSTQSNGGQGQGNDYSYFGVFPNSNTGLHPADAYGEGTYVLNRNLPSSGESIRITGYGSTSSPVSPTLYLVQKTHTGPEQGSSGTTLRYRTDTTGGNSGSPVIQEGTGMALGVHTHGGCTSGGSGANVGTSLVHTGFAGVLDNPAGSCVCAGPNIEVTSALPDFINSSTGYEMTFTVTEKSAPVDPTSIAVFADTGSGFQSVTVASLGNDAYSAMIPAGACAEAVSFYLYAEDTTDKSTREPRGTTNYEVITGDATGYAADLDFETDPGWTVQDTDIITGTWQRGAPNGINGAPATDGDGSGQAYLTGLIPNHDVDGGPTVLTTTVYDLSDLPKPFVSYYRYVRGDPMLVEVRADGGAWMQLENANPATGWVNVEYEIPASVVASGSAQFRFTASDNPNNSTTEAGVDGFKIFSIICADCPADLTGEGDINTNDFFLFLSLYQAQDPRADFAPGGGINTNDFFAYLAAYQAGC